MGRLEDRLINAGLKGINRLAEDIFARSQASVPVDRGTLKKSGGIRKVYMGVEIFYRAPYAIPVERGFKGHEQEVKKHYVMGHQRKRFRGRKLRPERYINVTAHSRGPFTRYMPERHGRFFFAHAVDEVRPMFGKIVGRELQRELTVRRAS